MRSETAVRSAEPASHESRGNKGLLLVPVTVLVLVAFVVTYHLWPVAPPYPASALHLRLVSLELVPGDQAQARVDELFGAPRRWNSRAVANIAYDRQGRFDLRG